MVGYGLLGTWFEAWQWLSNKPGSGLKDVVESLVTFFPALVGATSLQTVIEDSEQRPLRGFAILAGFVFFVLAIFVAFARLPDWLAFTIATLASVGALWIWVIANARHPGLQDRVDDRDSVGGPVEETPLSGDLSSFTL